MEPSKGRKPHLYTYMETVLQTGRLAHAYLFLGPAGAGKGELANLVAKYLFCQDENRPCGHCINCIRIDHGHHPDVLRLKPDGQSIKIDQVREIQHLFARRAHEGGWRVLIIEEADRLTLQGANSLLKFVEEPEERILIFFLARSREKVLPTIRSRCQELIFPPPSPRQLKESLAQAYGDQAAAVAAQLTSDLEEANQLCQAEWFAELQEIVLQLIEACFLDKTEAFFLIEQRWLKVAKEREQIDVGLDLMLFWYRDLIYLTMGLEDKVVYRDHKKRLAEQAKKLNQDQLVAAMQHVLEAKRKLGAHVHPQLLLEELVLQMKEDVHCIK